MIFAHIVNRKVSRAEYDSSYKNGVMLLSATTNLIDSLRGIELCGFTLDEDVTLPDHILSYLASRVR